MAASRVQRWAVFLLGYNYETKHIKGVSNTQADGLSRSPLPHHLRDGGLSEGKSVSYLNLIMHEIASYNLHRRFTVFRANTIWSSMTNLTLNF